MKISVLINIKMSFSYLLTENISGSAKLSMKTFLNLRAWSLYGGGSCVIHSLWVIVAGPVLILVVLSSPVVITLIGKW